MHHYVGTIEMQATNNENNVIHQHQFVDYIVSYSSQYGSDYSISYTATNLIGRPTIYPHTGDFNDGFLMRTYGPWWEFPNSLPEFPCPLPVGMTHRSQDFIEIRYKYKVFPTQMVLYEVLNPGSLTQVFAYDHFSKRWVLAWRGAPQKPSTMCARQFTVDLKRLYFATDLFRLEFNHRDLNYYYELDAVLLKGVHSDRIFPLLSFFNYFRKPDPERDKDIPAIRVDFFDGLPNEILHIIMRNLDLETLCSAARVSKKFKKLCYDPLLYVYLDLQPYWHKVTNSTLEGLAPRCQTSLRKLNLNWCKHVDLNAIIRFIQRCGQDLICFCYSNVNSLVSEEMIQTLSQHCPNLSELELGNVSYSKRPPRSFPLSMLQNLKWINLYHSTVDDAEVQMLVKNCSNIKYLGIANCPDIRSMDEILRLLSIFQKDLEYLDAWRSRTLTAQGILHLAEGCLSLCHLDISWNLIIDASSGCFLELFSHCTELKKIFLSAIRSLMDADLAVLASFCPQLEQLDLLGLNYITYAGVSRVLRGCPKLRLLDISFCDKIEPKHVELWRTFYPGVDIKHSYALQQLQQALSENQL